MPIIQSSPHTHRNTEVANLRKRLADIFAARDDTTFSQCISGGNGNGPYKGVRALVGNETQTPNGDEATHSTHFEGNFTKGMEHDPGTGLVKNPLDYQGFANALITIRSNVSFPSATDLRLILDTLPSFSGSQRRLVNPIAGVATDVTGVDAMQMSIPGAPALSSQQAAAELVELYWMALLRDVPFDQLGNNSFFNQAIVELNDLNVAGAPFAEHYVDNGNGTLAISQVINASTVFRGSAPGNDKGGYISQFLLQDAAFGTLNFEQKQRLLKSNRDYMTAKKEWLEVQNGKDTGKSRADLECSAGARHIITFRDLAHYVHFDELHEAYFNAALILNGLKAGFSEINPYNSGRQMGFGTFGGPHILVAVTEVATRALKAVWQQKWFVHRRLRPEAIAGRVHFGVGAIHNDATGSNALAEVRRRFNGSALLPMAFPEGSPMHPSYGAGHATVAGACVTILKAFFDTEQEMPNVVRAELDASGATRLVDDPTTHLTVGGELNKLAANIAIGRNAAGVHYRTDYTKSLALGEAVAMAMLQEQAVTLREGRSGTDPAWQFVAFDGRKVRILFDGTINCGTGAATAAKPTAAPAAADAAPPAAGASRASGRGGAPAGRDWNSN